MYMIKKKYVADDFDKDAIFRYLSSNIEYTNQINIYRLLTFQILIGSQPRKESENTLIYSRNDNNICFVLGYQNIWDCIVFVDILPDVQVMSLFSC